MRWRCPIVLPLIQFIPYSRAHAQVPLFLKRQCDRTPGAWLAEGKLAHEETVVVGSHPIVALEKQPPNLLWNLVSSGVAMLRSDNRL
jgi:hypothetical protein